MGTSWIPEFYIGQQTKIGDMKERERARERARERERRMENVILGTSALLFFQVWGEDGAQRERFHCACEAR